jgi:hypothetical protein
MASYILFSALLLVCPLAGFSTVVGNAEDAQSVAAVQKVIQMLSDMAAKAKDEKKNEEVAYAAFQEYCATEIPALKKSIAKGGETIDLLDSEIAKLTEEAEVLGEEIAKLQSDVASFEAEKKAKTAQREKDHAAFIAESTDYGESLSAIDRAITVLMAKSADVPAASAALLQLAKGDRLPAQAKAMVGAFLGMMGSDFLKSMEEPGMDYQAPEANAYEFQSMGIVDVLKKLKDDFREKLADCQKEEMNSEHAYHMIVTDLDDSIENSNKIIEEKKVTKAQKEEQTAMDKKELAATITTKKADEATLAALETECEEKKLSFTEKQQLRAEEIQAIEKAIEILKSPAVSANAEKNLDLAQTSRAAAFPQLRSTDQIASVNNRVKDFLASEGHRLHSRDLALLAEKIAADPFIKVKKLIGDMITRLLNEANEDANHHGFCTKEMGENKITRQKLTEDIDGLTAAVDEGKATILRLTEEIATLSKEVADLEVSMAEATKLRKEEKAANKATVEDAIAGQTAVAAATAVLKTFYEKASMATGFLQVERPRMGTDEWKSLANPNYEGPVDKGLKIGASWGHQEGMQTFGKKYTGMQDEAGGVMGLLEVIESDFANLEADTKAAEAKSEETYEGFMVESKKTKAVKTTQIEMDNADKAAATQKLAEDTKDLKQTQDELLAADRYYEKLVPQCIDQGMTWEERVKARESEIASLKEALKILSTGPRV